MPETATVTEKKQEKAGNYSGYLFTATVTAEGAGAVCEEEAKVDIIEAGIRLNLMRIGLINRTPKHPPKILKEITEEQFQEFNTKGLPKINLSQYSYALTSLRKGYLYIVKENDTNGWSEWEIGEANNLIEITNNQSEKDIRISNSESQNIKQYVATPEDHLYIAYSDFQWSATYWKKMRTDCDARAKRMQVFEASKFKSKTDQPNVMGPVQAQKHVSTVPEDLMFNILQQNYTRASADAEKNEVGYEIDTVICIDDPSGIALDINQSLMSYWVRMEALLISHKIGCDTNLVEKQMREGKKPEQLQKDTNKLKQVDALFNIASTWKSVALFNDKRKEDLVEVWGGLDMKRIDLVLGDKQRKECREKISSARKALLDYLESDYFKKCKIIYTEFSKNGILTDVKQLFQFFLKQLAPSPAKKDSFLLTKDEVTLWQQDKTSKRVQKYITSQLQGQGIIGEVLKEQNILEKIESKKDFLKFISFTDTTLEILSQVNVKGQGTIDAIVRVLQSNTVQEFAEEAGEELFELSDWLTQYKDTNAGEFTKRVTNLNRKTKELIRRAIQSEDTMSETLAKIPQIVVTKGFEKAMESKLAKKGIEIKNHPLWNKLLRNVSALNFVFASTGIRNAQNDVEKILGIAKIIHASLEVLNTQNTVKAINMTKVNKALTKAGIAEVKFGKIFNRRLGYFGALIDASESAYNFWERDYDAAIGYGIAAVSSAASIFLLSSSGVAILGALGIGGSANFWNPIGWGCLLLAAGIGIWTAFKAEDSPMQRLAKNGVFGRGSSDEISIKGKDTITVINAYIKNVDEIHKTGFTAWQDLTTQYHALMNMLINGTISIKSNKAKEITIPKKIRGGLQLNFPFDVKEMIIEFNFGGMLTNLDDLNIDIIYYPKGRDHGNPQILSKNDVFGIYSRNSGNFKLKLVNKSKSVIAQLKFNLPKRLRENSKGQSITKEADIMVMAYLGVSSGKGQFVPLKTKNGELQYITAIHAIQIQRNTGKDRVDYKRNRDLKGYFKGTKEDILQTPGWI